MILEPYRLKLLSIVFLALSLIAAHSAFAVEVSLKDAYRSALEKTETVPIGKSRIDQSDARIGQARARFLPTLNVEGSYQQQDTTGLSGARSTLFGGRQSYSRLTLSQSIFEGGRDLFFWNASKANKEVARHNLTFANYNLFTTVAQSF